VVPRLAGTAREIDQVLRALEGRFIAAGPSVAAARTGQRLPTGRNFYSVDPKAVPSRLAWETGVAMAGFAAHPLPHRPRRLAALGRPVGVGHLGDADLR
jgi:cobalamin biosynthesis Mg chelatase CobN